ncbi:unnamed protein product [Parnassius mnemosyne]|uniref:Reverse transcriptase domain-containing protein n=1 Tax=Parnassius mnemosyne TaxID=213953 RepID=A0AAV1KA23_9NEOP
MLGKELEIELFLNSNSINILCITEHWLKEYNSIFNFSNHQVVSSFNRDTKLRGGSLILANKSLSCKERKDIVSLSVERTVEMACVELEHLIVVSVYRPPCSSYDTFEKIMEEVLVKLNKQNKSLVVCGDFNINLLETSSISIKFCSLFKSYNLNNLFFEATRIAGCSATCIDNIFTGVVPINKSIIQKLSSDHCGQLVSLPYMHKKQVNEKIVFVPINAKRLERFRSNMLKILPSLSYKNNADYLYRELFTFINNEFNKTFTSKTFSRNSRKAFNEWATVGIYKSRRRLYDLYHERSYNLSDAFKEYVKNYSKMFKRVCSTAKSLHISNKIKAAKNKIKMTWSIINSETGNEKPRNSNYQLKINNELTKSNQEVAAVFEKYFTDVPILTTESLNASPTVAESLLKQNVNTCLKEFRFEKVLPHNIVKYFKTIDVKKTADLWGISVTVITSIIDLIAPHLAIIFNTCIDSGVFPDLMKYSKVIPLFKSGSTLDPANYRPISVLPTLSKIFEKIILDQLLIFFNTNKLLHKNQFGFTRGRSTSDAGVELMKYIFNAWENSQDALGIFCDLSKAFDCVHHDTLIRKLQHYGVKNLALKLITSYLSNRTQKVVINGKCSSGSVVSMGVPQGSILGPFLFLIYINDLPYLVGDNHDIVLFADDTSLIFKLKRQSIKYDDVNNALSKLVHWFNANNLLLNGNKTKCIKFTIPNVKHSKTNVLLNGEELSLVDTTVFLGITIDAKLQWGPHISKLASRLSSAAYAVRKIRSLTDVETARLVYFSYFHSVMSYGILLWGNATDIEAIFVLQKRAVRAIYNLNCKESLREKFKEINILTLASQYIYENVMYVHKNINSFNKNKDVHTLNTRNKHKLVMPLTRLHRISNSFMGQCIHFYNRIPEHVQSLSINKFKSFIKEKLYKKGYYNIKEYMSENNPWE